MSRSPSVFPSLCSDAKGRGRRRCRRSCRCRPRRRRLQVVQQRRRGRDQREVAAVVGAPERARLPDEGAGDDAADVVLIGDEARRLADSVQLGQRDDLFVGGDLQHGVGRRVDDEAPVCMCWTPSSSMMAVPDAVLLPSKPRPAAAASAVMIAGGKPFGNVAIAVSVTRPAISQWPVMVSLPADASRIAPQAPRGAARRARRGWSSHGPAPALRGSAAAARRSRARCSPACRRPRRRNPPRPGPRRIQRRRQPKSPRAEKSSPYELAPAGRIHYHGNIDIMAIARTRLTAQGQVSIPAEVRRRLGLTAGSVVEWDAEGDRVFVRRVGKYTSEDIHRAIFPDGPPRKISIEADGRGDRRVHAAQICAPLTRTCWCGCWCATIRSRSLRPRPLSRGERGSRTSSSPRRPGSCPGALGIDPERSGKSSRCSQSPRLGAGESRNCSAALAAFRARPKLGFVDCLILEIARKAGHLPLGTLDRELARVDGAERV